MFRSCVLIAFVSFSAGTVRADEPKPNARKAAERGLDFLVKDAAKWKKDRECATCHHGTLTVWALSEAKKQGFTVDAENFAATVKWTKERLKDVDKPRDMRPGWNMVSTPAVYLSTMALAIPKQEAISADELKRIAGHLVRHQEADGSWAWSLAPAKNRPPPVFESDEVVTLLAELSMEAQAPAEGDGAKSEFRNGRDKAAAWLAKIKPSDTTQSVLLWLYHDVRLGTPAAGIEKQIDAIFTRQNKDGSWGQVRDAAGDAYATGQALYFLSLAGVKSDRPEMLKAVSFLVKTQKEDGSWPMKQRSHPGEKPGNNAVPIIYFGSAWGTLGLLRAK